MPRAQVAPTPTTTDDQIVVGVDPGLDITGSNTAAVYMNAIMAPWTYNDEPSCDLNVSAQIGEPTAVWIGDGYFNDDVAEYGAHATRELGPEARRRIEEEVAQRLRSDMERRIRDITRSMQSLSRAAREATAHIQHFIRYFADFCYEQRQATGWLGDSDNAIETYRVRAHITRRQWREAATNWNEWQRRQRQEQQQWYLPRVNYTALSNSTNPLWPAEYRRAPEYQQWQWMAIPPVMYGATGSSANIIEFANDWTNYTTGSTGLTVTASTTWAETPLPCECDRAGTCKHCVERARVTELGRRRQQKKARQRQLAQKRGRRLLLSLLTDEQKHEYAKTRTFRIRARDGRLFRLRKGRTAELLNEQGQAVASYCIHLYGEQVNGTYVSYVDEDTTIAQVLMLQTEPEEFERIANITKLTPSPAVRQTAEDVRYQRLRELRARHAAGQNEIARAVQYLEEHDEAFEAGLRAEGIANPRQWVGDLRRQIRDRYHRGDAWTPVEPGTRRQAIALAVIEDEMHLIDMQAEARVAMQDQTTTVNVARERMGLPAVTEAETIQVIENIMRDLDEAEAA